MADAMEIASNYTIPDLPFFTAVAPLVHAPPAGDGRIWPLGSTGTAVEQVLTPHHLLSTKHNNQLFLAITI